ncbi:MAG: hypothetical protein LC685_05125 [Actinobacteria bacterium]|nr:hypothetical protein [Actinomycetota bacterium]
MSRLTLRVAPLIALILGLAACGSTPRTKPSPRPSAAVTPETLSPSPSPEAVPTDVPTPSATAAVAPADVTAVAERTFPRSSDAGQVFYIDCSDGGKTYAKCPFTRRLLARLQAINVPPCRCQNFFPQRVITTGITPTGAIAHVNFRVSRIDLVMVRSNGRLLVDDERCGGRGPSTSIYADAGPC